VQARTPFITGDKVRTAVAAFTEWSAVNPQRCTRVMFNFKALLEQNMYEFAHTLRRTPIRATNRFI
jgi:acyl-CoA reductase-like NAD-dependent aldehyde dehydrogenase